MRMLIASDLHGSMPALRFLSTKADEIKPDLILLLGDLVYHGPRNPLPVGYDTSSFLETISTFNSLPTSILTVRGNCDAEVDLAVLPMRIATDAWLRIDNFDMYACHGHKIPEFPPVPGIHPGMAILRGHTHIPRAETVNEIHIWNPGSLSLPKNDFPPSYGLYEDGIFRVFAIDGTELMANGMLQ